MSENKRRMHWDRPIPPDLPERITFWRGGTRAGEQASEVEYVRADLQQGYEARRGEDGTETMG